MNDLREDILELFAEAQTLMQDRRMARLYAWHWKRRIANNGSGWPTLVGGRVYCKDGYSFEVVKVPPQCRTRGR